MNITVVIATYNRQASLLGLLEDLAAQSGGKVFTPENAAELAELLTNQSVAHIERHEQKLYQWWAMLAVLVALLTLEWVGRKVAGLP